MPAEIPPPIAALLDSWELSMRARNLAKRTVYGYLEAARKFTLASERTDVVDFTKRDVQAHLADLSERRAPNTVGIRFRSLQQWFKWLTEEEEISSNPMAGMRPPAVPEQPVDVVPVVDLRLLLKTCAGKEYADRRDTAILMLFIDTGIRLEEMGGILVAGLDLRGQEVKVLGKGRRERAVPFGVKTAQAVDRYLRLRARHRLALDPKLWLGAKGKGGMTDSGIYQMVKRRGAEVGIDVHPHQFRHTFAHEWLDNGGNEGDLMQLAGWRSRSMLNRYGASAAAGRAKRAHRSNSLGDRL